MQYKIKLFRYPRKNGYALVSRAGVCAGFRWAVGKHHYYCAYNQHARYYAKPHVHALLAAVHNRIEEAHKAVALALRGFAGLLRGINRLRLRLAAHCLCRMAEHKARCQYAAAYRAQIAAQRRQPNVLTARRAKADYERCNYQAHAEAGAQVCKRGYLICLKIAAVLGVVRKGEYCGIVAHVCCNYAQRRGSWHTVQRPHKRGKHMVYQLNYAEFRKHGGKRANYYGYCHKVKRCVHQQPVRRVHHCVHHVRNAHRHGEKRKEYHEAYKEYNRLPCFEAGFSLCRSLYLSRSGRIHAHFCYGSPFLEIMGIS